MSNRGVTYDPALDGERLKKQLGRVFQVLSDHKWHSIEKIQDGCWWLRGKNGKDSQAGISARIRDLRKPEYGGYKVEHKRIEGGLWMYRLVEPSAGPVQTTMFEVR